MTTYPSPTRGTTNESREQILDRLIARYRTSSTEARGMLYSIAGLRASDHSMLFYAPAIDFLRLVGNETDKWELDSKLREVARQILYRQIMSALPYEHTTPAGDQTQMHQMLLFLIKSEANCPKANSVDTSTVLSFLKRCWKLQKDYHLPRWSHLVEVSVMMGYFDELGATLEDIKSIYWNLRSLLPEQERVNLEQHPCPIPPIGEGGLVIADSAILLAGRILNTIDLKDRYTPHVGKMLSLRAEWLVRENGPHPLGI